MKVEDQVDIEKLIALIESAPNYSWASGCANAQFKIAGYPEIATVVNALWRRYMAERAKLNGPDGKPLAIPGAADCEMCGHHGLDVRLIGRQWLCQRCESSATAQKARKLHDDTVGAMCAWMANGCQGQSPLGKQEPAHPQVRDDGADHDPDGCGGD